MNSLTSRLRWSPIRRVLATLFVTLTCLVGVALGACGGMLQANAAPLTPEARSYDVDRSDTQRSAATNRIDESNRSQEALKDTAETVREKLNLDEPLPESTRDFFKQIRGEKVRVEEPRPSGKNG